MHLRGPKDTRYGTNETILGSEEYCLLTGLGIYRYQASISQLVLRNNVTGLARYTYDAIDRNDTLNQMGQFKLLFRLADYRLLTRMIFNSTSVVK